ncbi:hypothetical protein MVEN_01437600 [Mycena venus]|uniref:Uncharacterized protein n=1 Tax=Mycena venus TaxID=2733690 RepID=A0A8H7CVR7_9AGAR|nr:hypothetical protein MVEN_01437600 [Mycena venus]
MMMLIPLGRKGEEGTWVDNWWAWWVSMQPSDCVYSEGKLTRPEDVDWAVLAQMHGKNGLLQVMATLLCWGNFVADAEVYQRADWTVSLNDVTWTLRELVKCGLIDDGKSGIKQKRTLQAEDEGSTKKPRRSTHQGAAEDARQTRSKTAGDPKVSLEGVRFEGEGGGVKVGQEEEQGAAYIPVL